MGYAVWVCSVGCLRVLAAPYYAVWVSSVGGVLGIQSLVSSLVFHFQLFGLPQKKTFKIDLSQTNVGTNFFDRPLFPQYFLTPCYQVHVFDTWTKWLTLGRQDDKDRTSMKKLDHVCSRPSESLPIDSVLARFLSNMALIPPPPLDGPRGGKACFCKCYVAGRDGTGDCVCFQQGKPVCPCFKLGRDARLQDLRQRWPLLPDSMLLPPLIMKRPPPQPGMPHAFGTCFVIPKQGFLRFSFLSHLG